MRPALRPALVVTVSLGLSACTTRTSNPPPPEMSHNPPMPQTVGGNGGGGQGAGTPVGGGGAGALEVATANTAPLAGNPPPPGRDAARPSTFKTHPRDAAGHVIFKDRQGGCFVEIPVPTSKPLEPGMRSIRVEKLVCPPQMSDPAYAKCVGGAIYVQGNGCLCGVGGNPPPLPVALECPSQ